MAFMVEVALLFVCVVFISPGEAFQPSTLFLLQRHSLGTKVVFKSHIAGGQRIAGNSMEMQVGHPWITEEREPA